MLQCFPSSSNHCTNLNPKQNQFNHPKTMIPIRTITEQERSQLTPTQFEHLTSFIVTQSEKVYSKKLATRAALQSIESRLRFDINQARKILPVGQKPMSKKHPNNCGGLPCGEPNRTHEEIMEEAQQLTEAAKRAKKLNMQSKDSTSKTNPKIKYGCHICGKLFGKFVKLKNHRKSHKENGNKLDEFKNSGQKQNKKIRTNKLTKCTESFLNPLTNFWS